ncbi:MAG: hypothetical protein ABIP54_02185 [Candidatus Andersenbacteria bacterium]
MSYTVTKLINDAYYASGIVSRGFTTVEGSQLNDGLDFLNDILADKTIEKDMVPYYTVYNFFAVAGQEKYFIPGLEELETLTFFLENIRYQMREVGRIQYFGSARADNISSLPFNWHLERCPGGVNIYLYFFPNTNYPIQAWGKYRLAEVSLNQDLMATGTTANFGIPVVTGAGNLGVGELVVNYVDLAGTYASAAALVTYINTGVVPNVTASIVGTEFVLSDNTGATIYVTSLGTQSIANNITFANFSTINGPVYENYVTGQLDRFYINYLKFSLADRLCTEFNFIVPPGVAKQLTQCQRWISKRSGPLDLKMQKVSTLRRQSSFNYASENLGKGWTI